ncbi:MAG TPA: WXG100 family type VII secretion target [Anaerolineae bacterium]|nr:WXG100 family type VII secretion target [Anaerolineae bacterium]MCB0179706.1 WXG100 family type VII secretion target [Anaerolineae bacterium]MCB0223964.1 WXG100 family type VII secretion target [Anaerolineae bacterium]MCB9105661.1 WXG100 family type VII secretion target [Anaerolineales bacterium]HRV91766.1 WXG100 family type VII secretion target [Anaerolineae bacterium]
MNEVYMNVPEVRAIAKTFNTLNDVLQGVLKALEAIVTLLKGAAFMGLVGASSIAYFVESLKPPIEEMADKFEELNKDLNQSVDAYENGDEQGATRFY